MTDPSSDTVAIIVAMTDPAPPEFAARLARFSEEAGPLGEVFVVDSSGKLSVEWLGRRFSNVRVLYRPTGRLAPELWRDGLLRTEAPLVAFTTAQMMLTPGWRVALTHKLRETDASGVGGPIEAGERLSGIDRATALLRYSRYFSPLSAKLADPPGDNALYRRDRLREVEASFAEGFWEIEVHQALRLRKRTLAMAESAVATFQGGSGWRAILVQRFRHGRRYGAERSRKYDSFSCFMRVAGSPLIPWLLCGRVLANLGSKQRSLLPWLTACPSLLILATAWTLGEVVGILQGPPVAPRGSVPRRQG